ncbi:MAG TPA: metallophosphoesterase [Gemmatimonadaceae bacterium]|nr:metallophosphoesterase [Gemmatimonadaceae bacterium]
MTVAQAERAVRAAAADDPDLVVHLGDYGYSYKRSRSASRRGYRRSMARLTPLLRTLRARDGVVALLGNHDYYYDAGGVRDWLESLGMHVLVNAPYVLQRGSARVVLLGIDDAGEGCIDVGRALLGAPDDATRILLSHNPDGVYTIEPGHRISGVIAGHTHGGQIVLPWYGAIATFCRICGRRTATGWVPNDHAPLYVTKGVGGMIPVRLNCTPEVLLVRLRRAPEGVAVQQPV